MSRKGDKGVLETYLQWTKPGTGIFYLLAIILTSCNQKGFLFFSFFLFLGLASYILYQAEKMSKNQEALTRLTQGIKRGLLLHNSLFVFLWPGLIFYFYRGWKRREVR